MSYPKDSAPLRRDVREEVWHSISSSGSDSKAGPATDRLHAFSLWRELFLDPTSGTAELLALETGERLSYLFLAVDVELCQPVYPSPNRLFACGGFSPVSYLCPRELTAF